ncbi:hypothetical protein MFIFM68171_01620 [Madurella fahalii]|uniref:Uncharacterized protein n=1 Tax=Madurella fahalii TaxID=1157608 RepID=A0ABQ0G0X0_9PEZI
MPRAGNECQQSAASASAAGTPQAAAVTPMEIDADGPTSTSVEAPTCMEIDTEVAAESPGRSAALRTPSEDPTETPTVSGPTSAPET